MANPIAPYPDMSPDNGCDWLYLSFAVGATGAVGAVTGGREFAATPVVREGVGDYNIHLRQGWMALTSANAEAIGALVTTDGVKSKIIANNVTSLTAPAVRFQFMQPGTGAAAEVASGATVLVTLRLKRGP